MEYGSTPYIGMAPKKWLPHCMCTKWYVQNSALDLVISFCGLYTCHSRVFSTVTRLLTLTESIAEVPNRQVAKLANRSFLLSSFFWDHSTTMTEAITIIQKRRSATGSGLLHPHHSVLKQIIPFNRDSQVLEASTCHYTPFCSVPLCVLNATPETQPQARAVLLRHL